MKVEKIEKWCITDAKGDQTEIEIDGDKVEIWDSDSELVILPVAVVIAIGETLKNGLQPPQESALTAVEEPVRWVGESSNEPPPKKRGPGRPKGSKTKPKEEK